MTTGYQIYDENATYFLTFQIVDWVDIFTRKIYKDIVIESFKFCIEKKGLRLFSFVIMSNHIHLIASANEPFGLSAVIRDFKKFTSRKFLIEINRKIESRKDWMLKRFEFASISNSRSGNYQIWANDNHAISLISDKFYNQKLNYIHENPVRAGIVEKAEDYLYSSARNYCGLEGVIEVEFI